MKETKELQQEIRNELDLKFENFVRDQKKKNILKAIEIIKKDEHPDKSNMMVFLNNIKHEGFEEIITYKILELAKIIQ